MVTGHGHRSMTGIPVPVDINVAERKVLEQIPGIGKKQAGKIIAGRPYKDRDDVVKRTPLGMNVLGYITC